MPAIIKDKTKYQTAYDYRALLSAGTTSLYYFYGNPVSWATYPGGAFNDSTPPTPKDTAYEERQVWDGIIGLKRVVVADTKLGFRRINWTSGQYYDMYREDYDGSTVTGVSLVGDFTNTKPLSLARSTNVVLVDVLGDATTYRVYRCIDNRSAVTGNPIASTTKPTHTSATVQTTADGYKWKYLGQLDSTDINEFLTATVCPVPTTLTTATLSGGVSAVVMTSRGTGYTGTPTVTIKGDGVGLTLGTPVLSGGTIAYIPVTASGSGYTYVELSISGTGTAATAKAILAPAGGFGSFVEKELEPNFLCVRTTNINTDTTFVTRGVAPTAYGNAQLTNSNTPHVNGLVYRTVGLIENPYNYGTAIKATSTILTNFVESRFNVLSGATPTFGYRYYTAASGSANAVTTVVGVRSDAVSFDGSSASIVNVAGNYVTFAGGHPFSTGDAVTYYSGGGTSIVGSGISNGATLYVIRDSATQIRFATSQANAIALTAIDITAVGTGTVHKLVAQGAAKNYVALLRTTEQRVVANPLTVGNQLVSVAGYAASTIYLGPYMTFDGSSSGVVSLTNDTIQATNYPFITGDAVTYSNGGGTSITGLTNGNTYYVIKNTYNTLKLATTLANANSGTAIDLSVLGTGTTHSLSYAGSDLTSNPTVERYSGNMIFVEYRTPVTRSTSEKTRFVLEF